MNKTNNGPPPDPKNNTNDGKPKMQNPFTRIGNLFKEKFKNDPNLEDEIEDD